MKFSSTCNNDEVIKGYVLDSEGHVVGSMRVPDLDRHKCGDMEGAVVYSCRCDAVSNGLIW
jgi:hypothetical protein